MSESVIAKSPPNDGRDWDCQCARCGSSVAWEDCGACGGEGMTAVGDLYEQDPLWYNPDDQEVCHQCGGQAAYSACLSSPDWCESHPLAGRENVKRGEVEWFTFDKQPPARERAEKER